MHLIFRSNVLIIVSYQQKQACQVFVTHCCLFHVEQSYLPSQTPNGLQRLRKNELENQRGDATGERKTFERIYDYDVYNDLGNPDDSDDLARPVLGGSKELPYPRRCRTGRPRSKKDPLSESWSSNKYIPRDEAFSEVKQATFTIKVVRSVVQALLPSLDTALIDPKLGFPYFTSIDALYNEGLRFPKQEGLDFFRTLVPRLVKSIAESTEQVLLFETPELIDSKFLVLHWRCMTKTRNVMQRACTTTDTKKMFPIYQVAIF